MAPPMAPPASAPTRLPMPALTAMEPDAFTLGLVSPATRIRPVSAPAASPAAVPTPLPAVAHVAACDPLDVEPPIGSPHAPVPQPVPTEMPPAPPRTASPTAMQPTAVHAATEPQSSAVGLSTT